ncbi:MAG: ABC transporter permease [Desulfurococcaceae archaeon]
MPRTGYVILRRGLTLLTVFILVVIIIAAILEGSGFSEDIYKAYVREYVNADIMSLRRAGVNITESYIAELRENLTRYYMIHFGLLDQQGNPIPKYIRMWKLVHMALTLDFGETVYSTVTNVVPRSAPAPVSEVILAVLPRTILIVTIGELVAIAIALLLGPRIAYRHGSFFDKVIVAYAALFNAIPIWWLAMLFILFFGYQLKIFPTNLRGVASYLRWDVFLSNPLGTLANLLWYISLPLMVFVISVLGSWLYGIRAMVLRIVREDYVTVAKAKGLPEKDITQRYVLRVSMAPVLTSVILALAGSLGGMIITESVFDWPGMGTLYYSALVAGDTTTIMALFIVYVGVYIMARFILEILYIIVDPRVRAR